MYAREWFTLGYVYAWFLPSIVCMCLGVYIYIRHCMGALWKVEVKRHRTQHKFISASISIYYTIGSDDMQSITYVCMYVYIEYTIIYLHIYKLLKYFSSLTLFVKCTNTKTTMFTFVALERILNTRHILLRMDENDNCFNCREFSRKWIDAHSSSSNKNFRTDIHNS